jgi:hypothetical protein
MRLYTDYGKIYNDVITNISTNTTPNVCITYPDHIATYMTGDNVVVPLDSLISDSRYGLAGSELKFDGPSAEEIVPQFIQVEAHPYFTQQELRKTLDKYGIKLMSWYPLGHGDQSLINEPLFAELGKKYGKTPAQVILRWHTQMGFAVIPGSRNVDHIRDNLNILDFTLTQEEMNRIAGLDKGARYYHRTDEQLVQFAGWRPAFEKA